MTWGHKIGENEFEVLLKNILALGRARNFETQSLGSVGSYPIWLMFKTESKKPNVLVAGGFHGDEPAGSYGILKFLKTASDELLNVVNLSFLPIINPTGIRNRERENIYGENPNRGFCHAKDGLSHEGQILMKHMELLRTLCSHGFVSLHEDIDKENFFLYTFEKTGQKSKFSYHLRQALDSVFKQRHDGPEGAGGIIDDGIVFNECDGSLEDYLYHKGVPYTACTETPGTKRLELRAEANKRVIESFIYFAASLNTHPGNS